MSKQLSYKEVFSEGKKKFECLICTRRVSSKHYILHHLVKVHNLSPVKKVKKLYVDDASAMVPQRTSSRWKNIGNNRVKSISEKNKNKNSKSPHNESLEEDAVDATYTSTSAGFSNPENKFQNEVEFRIESSASSSECDVLFTDCNSPVSVCDVVSENESDISVLSSCEDLIASDNISVSSSSFYESTDLSTCSEESLMYESTEDLTSFTKDNDDFSDTNNTILAENEQQALKILRCFQRNHLSKSACKDILETIKGLFPDSEHSHILDYNFIQNFIDKQELQEIHYCEMCGSVFPNDINLFRCDSQNCTGLRYKGPISRQQKGDRQPRRSYVIADIRKQLSHLLLTPGILQEIRESKNAMNHCDDSSNTIKDITDGSVYRGMVEAENGFLKDPFNLTGIINTDGVNLYSSTKVELWPVFLAINELSPKVRFSRENMLLLGIWQGKGKPPFKHFFGTLTKELNCLYNDGIEIEIEDKQIVSRLAVICGVFDLPAKASVLNMTFYNGSQACITCEEPGITVKQGKGSSRCYPFRNVDSRYPLRLSGELIEPMQNATEKKRIKGFRGISCLASLQSYDLVKGTVPDYMHGVLLGITNMLLSKWFSPTQSGKPYFIGKHIKTVSKRLQNIRPPACIERLPRDLEKHYQNLKATELQAWLLFYSLPCLSGILPHAYLRHFAYLSEAVYILLGDNISSEMLSRASVLLEEFYADFEELYGLGSCGLNVHNACCHLVWYVKLLGPLWAWSCFPFEDANAMLLKSVHGTGVVMKQILQYHATVSSLRKKGIRLANRRLWKVTHKANNCDICGKFTPVTNRDIGEEFLTFLGTNSIYDLKKVDRISLDGKQFCSLAYTRMQKRIDYIVLYDNEKVGSVQYFIHNEVTNSVFAVLKDYDKLYDNEIEHVRAGKHLVSVKVTSALNVVPAEKLTDRLIYIDSLTSESYVALMPNVQGHAIFK